MTDEPPRDVLTQRLQEAIGGRTVESALFTTFRFEPAFFEQEILTALFDVTWHHVPKLRILQFEEVLRRVSGKLAVYYDQRALVESDLGSPALDVRRIPCWPGGGYFHPKTTFVIVERDGGRALVTMTSSANLTRAGWWQNVEAAVIEEIAEGGRSRMRDEMLALLTHLRAQTRTVQEHAALDAVRDFLRSVTQMSQRTGSGHLHPHFHSHGRKDARTVGDFIADTTRGTVHGWSLEVISPYVDDADASIPLIELVRRFGVRDVRVLVPEDNGRALCRETLYEDVQARGWEWGRLPEPMTSGGKDSNAAARKVHAKVYRFFKGYREIIFVGSANLTNAGHQTTGNVEAGVLFERRHGRRVTHWLSPIAEPPAFFAPTEEEEGLEDTTHKLVLRYDWSKPELASLWQSAHPSPRLRVFAHGVLLFAIEAAALPSKEWHALEAVDHDALQTQLRSSSFLTVVDDDERGGVLLVLEVGMAYRPSLILDLTPAEILQYWALLTADQRADYLAQRGEELEGVEGAEALVAATRSEKPIETMFDRFAGMFHGFASLERKVITALEEDRLAEAEFLVFGRKPDSLRRLIDRVAERTHDGALTDDYLLLLCAQQLVSGLKRSWPEFWASASGAPGIEAALKARGALREALVDANGEDMRPFLDWHERKFLQTAEQPIR
jgi:hypothetical protein